MGSGNKYIVADRSKLLKNKLEQLAVNLNQSVETKQLGTTEQLVHESVKVLNTFYKDLTEPVFEFEELRAGVLPDPAFYNFIFQQILDDLIVIFKELENVESLAVTNFNFATTEANRIHSRLKKVASDVGDYILYTANPTKDVLFFEDSFNNLSKLDVGSALLNSDECHINQEEGIAVLPLDTEITELIKVKETPVINTNSNGEVGNNHELDAQRHDDISKLVDNNADTWFEYERVTTLDEDDQQALVLDLTINLGEAKVINHIRVNPNNFGTNSSITIDEIETSIDGGKYISIKDDIPITGFVTEDEENIFILAPATSKYAGQGAYTFNPRKVKYIHLKFSQNEAYTIDTTEGEKLRYAIGIRDIDIYSLGFKNKGEFISKAFSSESEIKKILLQTNQNPPEFSSLTSIDYFVSHDNGQAWHQVQPKEFKGKSGEEATIPEILNFNNDIVENSVSTSIPVTSLRLKGLLKRNDDVFSEDSVALVKIQKPFDELYNVPASEPFEIKLNNKPIEGTFRILDPLTGSLGLEKAQYSFKADGQSKFYLPFSDMSRPLKKVDADPFVPTFVPPRVAYYIEELMSASEWIHVFVGGEEWAHAIQPLSDYTANYSTAAQYRLYTINLEEGILEFGTGENTMAPPSDASIGLYFEPRSVFPSEGYDNHVAKLYFSASSNKDALIVQVYYPGNRTVEQLPKAATVVNLEYKNISDVSGIETEFGAANRKTFINGKDELVVYSDWSIDTENGIIYLGWPTSASEPGTIEYGYQEVVELSKDNWDWVNTNFVKDSIRIKESGWKSFFVREEKVYGNASNAATMPVNVLHLRYRNIVKGTLFLNHHDQSPSTIGFYSDAENPFVEEVDFIDGSSEFEGFGGTDEIQSVTESLGTLVPDSLTHIATYTLKENITDSSDYGVSFGYYDQGEGQPVAADASFVTEKSSKSGLAVEGDYYIEKDSSLPTYRNVYIYLDTTISGGIITYFYVASQADKGVYSVEYENGRIYTQRPTVSGWFITANYQYTDYRVKHKIVRRVDPDHYEVDYEKDIVTIKDEEILKRELFPDTGLSHYQISYDSIVESREDIAELRDYFTPVLKDYNLKILTKDSLV